MNLLMDLPINLLMNLPINLLMNCNVKTQKILVFYDVFLYSDTKVITYNEQTHCKKHCSANGVFEDRERHV